MKCMRRLLLCFLAIGTLYLSTIIVSATGDGLKTNEITQDEKNRLYTTLSFSRIQGDYPKYGISCFDVNTDGLIAIGNEGQGSHAIQIINSNGEFQYAYSFPDHGSFRVDWDGDTLLVYLIRSNLLVSLAPNGDILDIKSVPTSAENSQYVYISLDAKKRISQGVTYEITEVLPMTGDFSVLQKTDIQGNTEVLYEVTERVKDESVSEMIKFLASILIFIAAFVTIGIQLFRSRKAHKR